MKYFAPIFVWYIVVFLHIILTLNVEEVRTQHLQNGVKKTKFCYDKGIQGLRLKSEILKTLKNITEMLCVVRCVRDPCCRSVNFKRNSSNEGYGDCELLHDLKNSTSSEMHEKHEMYEHIPLLEPRKKYMICCKVCNGSGTHKPDSGTCFCTPTDGSSAYEKDIDNCISNPCHAKATCKNSGNSFVCVCKKGYVGISALKNVALNKVTKQSSTVYSGNSDRAVDGNKNTNYASGKSCTHTHDNPSPWWMVDLGQEYNVHHLKITNRGDCCYERLSNFQIRIGNFQANNTDENPECGGYYSLGRGETRKIICPAPMKGRYVIIRIPGITISFSLCEVEVYEENIVKECIPDTSCKEMAFRSNSSLTDVVYEIQQHETSENYSAYCHMLGQCGGGGWSLVMKIDGNKDTFNYGSHFWSDNQTYQVPQGLNGLTEEESKLASYWNIPFTKICLGMKVNGVTNWIKMDYQASSLYSVIADGMFRPTDFGRAAWLSLIDGSGLQKYCNREGFNVDLSAKMRLGIAGNNEKDCKTCDSFIGFGNDWRKPVPPCGDRTNKAFGYILVQ